MYEFPSLAGYVCAQDVVRYLENVGYRVLHIKELEKAKHIFSHVEWQMKGYAVKVEENGFSDRTLAQTEGHILVHPDETKEAYPIPSAFRAYTHYVNI